MPGHQWEYRWGMEGNEMTALERQLVIALEWLLDCPDLNLDELEPETRRAISHARAVLAKMEGRSC